MTKAFLLLLMLSFSMGNIYAMADSYQCNLLTKSIDSDSLMPQYGHSIIIGFGENNVITGKESQKRLDDFGKTFSNLLNDGISELKYHFRFLLMIERSDAEDKYDPMLCFKRAKFVIDYLYDNYKIPRHYFYIVYQDIMTDFAAAGSQGGYIRIESAVTLY